MKTLLVFVLSLSSFLFSCNNSIKKSNDENEVSITDTLKKDSFKSNNYLEVKSDTISKNITHVFGYRFIISGDFDGNGKKEKLIEHYFSALDNKETNKFYDGLDEYDNSVEMTIKKKP